MDVLDTFITSHLKTKSDGLEVLVNCYDVHYYDENIIEIFKGYQRSSILSINYMNSKNTELFGYSTINDCDLYEFIKSQDFEFNICESDCE